VRVLKTILIVDDSEHIRKLIKNLVWDLAETIVECTDGTEVLAAYQKHHPDWVLMDIKMKMVDGIDATRQIKMEYPDAKIMIVTDFDVADLREAAFRAGAREYVVKEDLLSLRRILQGRQVN
jgi:two-component system chemotaxis response regulator CheY